MEFINLPILLFSLLLSVSILTSFVSFRIGIPLILVFLFVGLLGGQGGFDLVEIIPDSANAFFVGSVALALILFDSGYHTPIHNYRSVLLPSVLLATIGVIMTAAFLMPIAKEVLLIGWLPAFLLASIISSTDSASVFFLLRNQGISLREKMRATLEVESGANDPMAIFLTLSCILLLKNVDGVQTVNISFLAESFLSQLFVGLGMGVLLGFGLKMAVNKLHLEHNLYPILVLALTLFGFAGTNMLNGSGFLAMYVAGLILGNSRIQAALQISKFQKTLTWLCQIVMFISLGLFVSFDGLGRIILPAVIISCALIFVARPLMVWAILSFFPAYSVKEKWFISAVGLRGATSILLAIAPIVYQIEGSTLFFNIIFVMVVMSLGFQGFLIPILARWFNVQVPVLQRTSAKSEIDLPGMLDSSLLMYELNDQSPVVLGKRVPKWARPTLVVRDGVNFDDVRKFKVGDKVYVLSSSDKREKLLDQLFGGGTIEENLELLGDFPIPAETKFGDLQDVYGVHVAEPIKKQSVGDFLSQEIQDLEIGDRLNLDMIDLVVREIDENGVPSIIGVDIDPSRHRKLYTRTLSVDKCLPISADDEKCPPQKVLQAVREKSETAEKNKKSPRSDKGK